MESGGFHGFRKVPNTNSGLKLTDMKMRVQAAAQMKQANTTTNNNSNNHHHHSTTTDDECTVREQDRFMPIANVIRIMRKILPPHAKISDDAKETIQECVSEYISFITGEANERCQREQRKTITAEDVLWAMSKLGFDDYIEPLTMYLHRYREMEGDRGGSSIRGETLGKRTVEYGTPTLGPPPQVTGFGPAFHIGHLPNGFFGAAAAMGGYMRDGAHAPANASSSQGGFTNADQPNGQYK